MPTLIQTLRTSARRLFALIFLICLSMLAFGLYLQHVVGLEPCPMCIVQRYALSGIALFAALGALSTPKWAFLLFGLLNTVFGLFGAFVAARQSWLQWYPPEVFSCGRDFYGIIENTSLRSAIPMIFKGSGDCTKVDWTLFGGSIANWSFACFVVLVVMSSVASVKALHAQSK
jgi:protein dithiol:quinone oxidoreductase